MKVQVLSLSLVALAALAATSSPGIAGGDWTEAGISNYNASVAVPAPIPVAVNAAQWYLRLDGGWAAGASGDVTATGVPVDTFDFESGSSFFSWGFGIGYRFTPQWRAEVAGDWTNKVTTSRYTEGIAQDLDIAGPSNGDDTSIDTLHYAGNFDHKTTLDSASALVNVLYDINTGTWFTPYIGGGLGLSVHSLRVVGDSRLSCQTFDRAVTDGGDGVVDVPPLTGVPCSASDLASRNSNTITSYGLAANLLAGVGVEVYDGIYWDTGYRLMYRGGTPSISYHTPLSTGTIEIDSRIDHELRTGLRFDIF
jgi:opacity protein-like surface antigen